MAEQKIELEYFETVEVQITEGPDKGRKFALHDGVNIIGRVPEAEVHLDDNIISRNHASLTIDQDIALEDMGSAQGTVLNGRMLMGRDFLFDNDEIKVGPYVLRLSISRKESRKGITVGLACLVVATIVFAIAITSDSATTGNSSSSSQSDKSKKNHKAPSDDYRNWETVVMPDRQDLVDEEILKSLDSTADPREIEAQFSGGTRRYQDRLGDLGNAYRAVKHYKQAIALSSLLPPAERPAIANRSLQRIKELQKIIRSDCEKRVATFKNSYLMQDWKDCYRVLREIRQISPWSGCRYNRYANIWLNNLNRKLK